MSNELLLEGLGELLRQKSDQILRGEHDCRDLQRRIDYLMDILQAIRNTLRNGGFAPDAATNATRLDAGREAWTMADLVLREQQAQP